MNQEDVFLKEHFIKEDMTQQVFQLGFVIHAPVREEEVDHQEDQIRNIDLQETLLHEFPEFHRSVKIAEIQSEAGAEDEDMPSRSAQ